MDLSLLLAAIIADYNQSAHAGSDNESYVTEARKKFADGLSVEMGKKYIRVVCDSKTSPRVWGFVVNCHDDKQFKYGDILKAAGWKAPAKNKARGNVIAEDFSMVRWTSPEYLK